MKIASTGNAEGLRIDQQRIDQERVEARKMETQNNREVSETPKNTAEGRGDTIDLNA